MNQVVKVFFKHKSGYFAAFITIVHEFETDFIYIEFLDEEIVEIFNSSCFSYIGQKGYETLTTHQSVHLRSILYSVGNIIVQHIENNLNSSDTLDEVYIRQN